MSVLETIMATTPIGRGSALVTLPSTIPPAPAVMAILDRFNRNEIGNTIEVLVALLDIWDGDSDLEVTDAEDDFDPQGLEADPDPDCEDEPDFSSRSDGLPGDPDDAEPDDDGKGDPAYCEWHSLPAATRRSGALNAKPIGVMGAAVAEDDEEDDAGEDDDPSGQCDEDEVNTAFGCVQYTVGGSGPGCPIADTDHGSDGS
jgi:hypothetical protein